MVGDGKASGLTANEVDMFKRELKQLPYLERELKMWKEELAKNSYDSSLQSPMWSGVRNSGNSDKTANSAIMIEQNKKIIQQLIYKIEKQKNKLLAFIDAVDDSLYRQILYYRNIKGLEWNEVARYVGGANSDASIKKMYSRIFDKPYNFFILTQDTLLQ